MRNGSRTANEWRGEGNAVPTEALAQFIAGGLFGLLNWWLNGRMATVSFRDQRAVSKARNTSPEGGGALAARPLRLLDGRTTACCQF
jgi:hypothetical protein